MRKKNAVKVVRPTTGNEMDLGLARMMRGVNRTKKVNAKYAWKILAS